MGRLPWCVYTRIKGRHLRPRKTASASMWLRSALLMPVEPFGPTANSPTILSTFDRTSWSSVSNFTCLQRMPGLTLVCIQGLESIARMSFKTRKDYSPQDQCSFDCLPSDMRHMIYEMVSCPDKVVDYHIQPDPPCSKCRIRGNTAIRTKYRSALQNWYSPRLQSYCLTSG